MALTLKWDFKIPNTLTCNFKTTLPLSKLSVLAFDKMFENHRHQSIQECIPVGCVPPARRPHPGMQCLEVYLPRGVYLPGGTCWGCICRGLYLPGGVHLPGGCTCPPEGVPAQVLPPVNRMRDRCKNITFANFVCGR